MRRFLLSGLAVALAVVSVPAAAFPALPATPAKLDQLATDIEGMHGGSRIADQRIADMLRSMAAAQGITIPTIASAYTEFANSAQKLRPTGWLISIQELNNGYVCATVDKWDSAGLAAVHEKGGRSNVVGPTAGGIALSAAMLRAWAQVMREQAAPATTPTAWNVAPLTVGGFAFLKNQGPCCQGIIVRVVSHDAMWGGTFYQDATGNFPASNLYWRTVTGFYDDNSLQGVAPTS